MLTYYYPRTIKNIVVALTDLFDDIVVYKYTSAGDVVKEIDVPITFGPMEKAYQEAIEDHEYIQSANDFYGYTQVTAHGKRYYIQLPRMALVLNGIAYNAERAYGVNEWRYWFAESLQLSGSQVNEVLADYQPTPYDLNFTLHIRSDSMDYLSQILENILPYFNPKLELRVKEFSFLNIERDLPVSLDGVNPEFVDDQNEPDDRYINASLNLTVEAFMYRPFSHEKVIKIINSKYYIGGSSLTSGGIIDTYNTSGVKYTSAGDIPTSAVPESYTFSGTYRDDIKDFAYFTSANVLN